MRKLAFIVLALTAGLVACNDNPPPTQIVMVVTATPADMATPDTVEPPSDGSPAVTPSTAPTVTQDQQPTSAPAPVQTSSGEATPRPAAFPTDMNRPLQIVEQVYQHGRMFWLRHNLQIWVMQASPDDPDGGDWFCYNDTFQEGEPETDPNLVPPENADEPLYQPRRGFGKLWRGHPELQAGMGWAKTPEFELTSNYTYIAGGHVDASGQYVRGPGEHRLTTLDNESISFFESDIRGDCVGGTWHVTGQ